MKRTSRRTPRWLAWCITLGEAVLLVAFGLALSRYWLMLPVGIRTTALLCLLFATAILLYRLFRFHRRQRQASVRPPPLPPNS